FFPRGRRHRRWVSDWSSDVCSSDLADHSSRVNVVASITLGSLPAPTMQATTFTRLEWSADIVFFGLFLVTAVAVWLEGSEGVSPIRRGAGWGEEGVGRVGGERRRAE